MPRLPITPDVFVREMPNGTYAVELNADTLPRVLLDRTLLRRSLGSFEDGRGQGVHFRMPGESANWLIKSLDQRARTILKVSSSEIVRQQDGFFVIWRACAASAQSQDGR